MSSLTSSNLEYSSTTTSTAAEEQKEESTSSLKDNDNISKTWCIPCNISDFVGDMDPNGKFLICKVCLVVYKHMLGHVHEPSQTVIFSHHVLGNGTKSLQTVLNIPQHQTYQESVVLYHLICHI